MKRFDLYYKLMLDLQESFQQEDAICSQNTSDSSALTPNAECISAGATDRNRSQYVMLSDVRDVVAQSNPFTMARQVSPGKIIFSMEDSRVTLGACPFNSQWILELYGEDMLEDMADHRISCSGVTLGPLSLMLRYVHTMHILLGELLAQNDGSKVIRKGSDQGVHNCVVHGFCRIRNSNKDGILPFDPAKDAALLPNEESVVQTLGWVPWDGDLRDRIDARRVREARRVVLLLHQFDRHAELYQVVVGMYPWWEPTIGVAESKKRWAAKRKTRRKRQGKKKRKKRRGKRRS